MAYKEINDGFTVQATLLDDSNGESYDISETIQEIMVKKAFIENTFPLYVINFRTTEEMRNRIRDDSVRISLRIGIYAVSDENNISDEDINNVAEKGTLFDGIIRIYNKPYTTTAAKKEDEDENNETQSQSVPFVYYQVIGIPEDLIEKNSEIINKVYSNASPTDILINLLSDTSLSSIYIEEPDNKQLYKSILIPPLNLIPAIEFLDNNYQIYYDGISIFLDSNKYYIYSPLSGKLEPERTIEYNIQSVESTANSQEYNHPLYNEETNNIKITSKNLPVFSSEEKIAGDSLGSDTVFYSYDDNFNLIKRSQSNNLGYSKLRYIWNGLSNKSFESGYYKNSKISSSLLISISNIDPSYFTPTTAFKLISDSYIEPNGDYILSEVSYSISTNDYKHYSGITAIKLLKK